MAKLALEYAGNVAAETLRNNMDKATKRVRAAMKSIAQEAAEEIHTRGIADISSAGRYGSSWTSGLHVTIEQAGADEVTIQTSHDKPFYSFLNVGGIIKGNPMLWIPTENNPTFGEGVPASQYPGRLISVNKGGVPLLIDPSPLIDRSEAVMYTGEPFVVMPQKFHILEIIRDVARSLKSKYKVTYATSR